MTHAIHRRRFWLSGGIAVTIGVLLMIGSIFVAPSTETAVAQEESTETQRSITVAGSGTVAMTPDTARVNVGVEATGANLTEVFENANEQMDSVFQAVEEFGIPDDQVEMTQFSIFVERNRESESNEITGYTVRNSAEITVSEIDRLPDLIATTVDAGANQVGNIRFTIEDRGSLIEDARELAMDDARQRAEHLAELAGVTLGSPMSIIETSGPVPLAHTGQEDIEAAAPPIEPGQQQVTVGVTVTYAME